MSRAPLTNLSPFVATVQRYCFQCGELADRKQLVERSPVPGLTVWEHPHCTEHQPKKEPT